jgi:pectinesterase
MKNTVSFFLIYLLLSTIVTAQERVTLVVDANGSGQFLSIQDALDSLPESESIGPVTILIRNGVYSEKIFITRSNIALVGEHRDSTRIVYAELRSNWTNQADNRPDGSGLDLDWGSAVINIGNGATDITIANLTVHNNYGHIHHTRDHQFTIRGFDATRIAILYSTVISDGGDAVALWNRDSGMYYHAYCHFEGWVDYVCPRGWCYITNSTFFGHNKTASLWHDGSEDKDQKFVIRSSYIDGVPGFPLGRHHRDGQFYLLDCTFSENMADRPIHYPDYSPNARPWIWGQRHYYYNCSRDGGSFDWFKDNLEYADGSPSHEQITAEWNFGGTWNPEQELPPVLPFASIPQPRDNAYDVHTDGTILYWISARDAVEYHVYFGESPDVQPVSSQKETSYVTGRLKPSTLYYWKVDVIAANNVVAGEIWKFKTGAQK